MELKRVNLFLTILCFIFFVSFNNNTTQAQTRPLASPQGPTVRPTKSPQVEANNNVDVTPQQSPTKTSGNPRLELIPIKGEPNNKAETNTLSNETEVKGKNTNDLNNENNSSQNDISSANENNKSTSNQNKNTLSDKIEYERKIYKYNQDVLDRRLKAFDWQHSSGQIIFGVVIFLVFIGVIFSGIQFIVAMKIANRKELTDNKLERKDDDENQLDSVESNAQEDKNKIQESKSKEEISSTATTIKASLSGIEVSSSILGVIILVISFLFFYLYLVYVYPITIL